MKERKCLNSIERYGMQSDFSKVRKNCRNYSKIGPEMLKKGGGRQSQMILSYESESKFLESYLKYSKDLQKITAEECLFFGIVFL